MAGKTPESEKKKHYMKLYIGNLSYDTTEAELREALSAFEPIMEVHLPMDRDTGRPRGFAFVTFNSRETGEEAIKTMDGATFLGRNLRVNEAEDRNARRPPQLSPSETVPERKDDRPLGGDGQKVRYKGI